MTSDTGDQDEMMQPHMRELESQGISCVSGAMERLINELDGFYNAPPEKQTAAVRYLPTGFYHLDGITGGLQPGDVVVVAGRPSMGKTSFACNVAEQVGLEQGLPVALFSREMSERRLITRFLASIGRIDQNLIHQAKLGDDHWDRLTQAIGKLHNAPIFMPRYTPDLTAMAAWNDAGTIKEACGGLGLVVVDSLQMLETSASADTRSDALGQACRTLKKMAMDLECPVIVTSTLSRTVESRPDKRPVLSDLRDSGDIEDVADIVIMLYRDEVYRRNAENVGMADAVVLKHRNGPPGAAKLVFLGEYGRFENYAELGAY